MTAFAAPRLVTLLEKDVGGGPKGKRPEKKRPEQATHCRNGHEYTQANTYFNKFSVTRTCRTCTLLNQAKAGCREAERSRDVIKRVLDYCQDTEAQSWARKRLDEAERRVERAKQSVKDHTK